MTLTGAQILEGQRKLAAAGLSRPEVKKALARIAATIERPSEFGTALAQAVRDAVPLPTPEDDAVAPSA